MNRQTTPQASRLRADVNCDSVKVVVRTPSAKNKAATMGFYAKFMFGAVFTFSVLLLLGAYMSHPIATKPIRFTPGPALTVQKPTSTPAARVLEVEQSDVLLSFKDFDAELSADAEYNDRFFFFWTTKWETWSARHTLFLDSLFIYHPNAKVYFVAVNTNTDLPEIFHKYIRLGYHLRGMTTTYAEILQHKWFISEANREWLQAAETNTKNWKYLFSHITDYLRFYLLYKYGGTYTDTDAIAMRRLPSIEFIGADFSDDTADWFLEPAQHLYLAPGVMRLAPNHMFISRLLSTVFFLRKYDPDCFNCVGPKAITLAMKEGLHSNDVAVKSVEIFPKHLLYPLSYFEVAGLFDETNVGRQWAYLQHLRRTAFSLHLFGKMTTNLHPANGSFMSTLLADVKLAGDSACRFAGETVIVVRGSGAEIANEFGVYLTSCPVLQKEKLRLTIKSAHGAVGWMGGAPATGLDKSSGFSVRDVNVLLASVVYTAPVDPNIRTDTLAIALTTLGGTILAEQHVDVFIYNRLVSILTHTHGRLEAVHHLHDSLQEWFPDTRLYATNDGDITNSSLAHNSSTLTIVPLPFDSGLSVGRNTLVAMVSTPYVHILDDDFTLSDFSHFDVLLRLLHYSPYAIASPRIPFDESTGWIFRGTMAVVDKSLRMERGMHGSYQGCEHVDFVPNIFMAKRAALLQCPWDNELKVGEHEEFFLRMQMNGFSALMCTNVEVEHHQEQWWKGTIDKPDTYSGRRNRVKEFWRVALKKHGLTSMFLYGEKLIDLNDPVDLK